MLNSEVPLNSQLFPKGFIRDYDAHVYYTPATRPFAHGLREKALRDFAGTPVFVGKLIDERVGPHPTPMFELNFSKNWFGHVFSWLRANRSELPVLVHEVTGNDPKDHSQGAIWLGRVLPLDESKLDPSP